MVGKDLWSKMSGFPVGHEPNESERPMKISKKNVKSSFVSYKTAYIVAQP